MCYCDGFGVVSFFSQLFNFVRRVVCVVRLLYSVGTVQYIRKRRSMCVFGVLAGWEVWRTAKQGECRMSNLNEYL